MTTDLDRRAAPMRGWISFGAVVLLVSGAFNIIAGLAGIARSKVYLNNVVLVSNDVRAWGWTWLIYGLLEVLVGAGILAGWAWARMLGVVLVGLNAIGHVIFIPAYPFWSIMIIVLDVVVIYALTVHGGEYAQPRR